MLNRKHPFWRQFPVVHKKVFQCDPLVTPESTRAGQTAAAEAAEAFFSGARRRACSCAAQLIDVSSYSS